MGFLNRIKLRNSHSGFTILELLVAVSVTALLAAMLLNITSQVVSTQTKASGDLETNQIAQFILDRIQEDLQCAISRNDGNVWMAAKILTDELTSGSWVSSKSVAKPKEESKRVFIDDWPDEVWLSDQKGKEAKELAEANQQGPLIESRYGIGGTWLRFFSQAPELDSNIQNKGEVRAIAYQIVRYGLTGADTSRPRYQLFRSDVSAENTFAAGFNLHPVDGNYNANTASNLRGANIIKNPISQETLGESPTSFSLASNIVDFGLRAYIYQKNSLGKRYLKQLFPMTENMNHEDEFLASTHPGYRSNPSDASFNAFPEVVDVMIRVLTSEGESAVSALEEGLTPIPEGYDEGEYWWKLAEENSDVYTRRIKIFSSSI
jgi:prepilin-type N-terminal cleavage/methylation domain-containing protein